MKASRKNNAYRRFLVWFCCASAGIAALIVIFLYAGRLFDITPPPAISANICFNEKVLFIHDRGGPGCDVLAIGSSTTLGDLNSAMLADAIGQGRKYLNAGAWGMTICETRKYLELLLRCGARPRCVVMVCAITDFYPPVGAAFWDANDTPRLVKGYGYLLATAKHFELTRSISEARQVYRDRQRSDEYTTLMFDQWGGAILDKSYPDVSLGRWAMKPAPEKIDPTQYEQLAGLADTLAGMGINFVLIQGPIRPAGMDDVTASMCRLHWEKISRIMQERSFTFINLQDALPLDDSMFADSVHLNRSGVAKFTSALLNNPDMRISLELTLKSTSMPAGSSQGR